MDSCPICGTTMRVIDGKLYCPNHGFIQNEEDAEENNKDKKRDYVQ